MKPDRTSPRDLTSCWLDTPRGWRLLLKCRSINTSRHGSSAMHDWPLTDVRRRTTPFESNDCDGVDGGGSSYCASAAKVGRTPMIERDQRHMCKQQQKQHYRGGSSAAAVILCHLPTRANPTRLSYSFSLPASLFSHHFPVLFLLTISSFSPTPTLYLIVAHLYSLLLAYSLARI